MKRKKRLERTEPVIKSFSVVVSVIVSTTYYKLSGHCVDTIRQNIDNLKFTKTYIHTCDSKLSNRGI